MTFAFILDSVPFTASVIAGETSLGGSESACLGLARALAARRHEVHIFTTQLADDCHGLVDHAGVTWHPWDDFIPMNQFIEWDVVCSLRMFAAYAWRPVYARLRLLWSQDLLVPGQMQNGVMATGWAFDHLCYVSEYHRKQWEALQPELTALGWVTRNGYDPRDLPAERPTKDPHRVIHISRPERGLGPLLAMWPLVRARHPQATLQVCRYSSMYDQGPGSWSDVCQRWDARIAQVNAEVGGITYLGELNKKQLYQAISAAAVMWYPGVASFAETNCIAALEAAACGTPFVGSYRGALPETAPTGVLIKGDAEHDDAYHRDSVQAVLDLLAGCARQSFDYRRRQVAGRLEAERWTYDVLAAQWEARIDAWFTERYQAHQPQVLRQLLHEDDHVAARIVATAIIDGAHATEQPGFPDQIDPAIEARITDAVTALAFCDKVIAGQDHTSEQYGAAAIQDPLIEAEMSGRFREVIPAFAASTSLLDVACGNGSFAIALAKANPSIRIHGLDYSAANIERATDGAQRAGVGDRCTFTRSAVYDFDTQQMHAEWNSLARAWRDALPAGTFDALFVGEFIEHVANYQTVIDSLEAVLAPGAKVVYTCPHGACAELVPRHVALHRGHVHRFHHDDVKAVWGDKQGFSVGYLDGGITERGFPLGNWLIQYEVAPGQPTGLRPLEARIRRTRPFPLLSVGIITKDAENDLARCLSSVYAVADEILVGDTGSTDATKAIATAYGSKVRVVDITPIAVHPQGFAGARNDVLAQCRGDWFLWIDSDEQLLNPYWLRRYLDGALYQGYVIRQTHLYVDGPPTADIPVRLFRNTGRVQFYGCVHEQPQDGHANGDIYPSLDAADLQVVHFGYLTQDGREEKRVARNLPLLLKDQQVFPQRLLGQVLLLREAVLQADAIVASHGQLTPKAQQGYAHAIRIFVTHFDDPSHKYHKLARPWYQVALQHLGLGWELEIGMAGKRGGLNGKTAAPEKVWVRDGAEYARYVAYKTKQIVDAMQPVTFVSDPDALLAPLGQDVPLEATA